MSWLFSQALVEEYSADTFSDGEPSAQWNVMPTPQGFWRNDKMMESSRLSRFGPTLRLLTADHGEAVLMSFLAAFPARTSVSPETGRGSTESDPASGKKWRASFAKYDRGSSSWKTHQLSLLGGSTDFSETWPRWGLMRAGECWERQTWAPITTDTGFGSSPRIPTPTVSGNYNRKGITKKAGDGLETFVRKFPTATATAHKGWSVNHNRADTDDRLDYTVEREAYNAGQPGRLNPDWEEWLMGWPTGWTALKPLAMDKYREWLQQHSPISQNNRKEIAC